LAIGSFPFDDPSRALDLMGANLDIPAAPQMVRLDPYEDMLLGATSGIPFLAVDPDTRAISVPAAGREEALASFYEKFYAGDLSFLARGPRSSLGFDAFGERARRDAKFGPFFLKTQVVGPLTFGQSVRVEGAFFLVDDPTLQEAAAAALGGKIAHEASLIRDWGRSPVAFLDEPGLSGYGSAFSTLSAERVLGTLRAATAAARSLGPLLVGVHVCGNTDWGLLAQADVDVVNCDAWGYMESVSLYPKELRAFLERGGYLAWGVIPSQGFEESLTPAILAGRLKAGFELLGRRGLEPELLAQRALVASSCGLGSLSAPVAQKILELSPRVQEELLNLYPSAVG
jgi:hypothetical protein